MTDRPIIFSAPMVRALIEGRKTQTRRVALITAVMGNKVPVTHPDESLIELEPGEFRRGVCHYASTGALSGPYSLPAKSGDRLWVREAWRTPENFDRPPSQMVASCIEAGYERPWAPIHWEADGFRTNWGDWRDRAPGRPRSPLHLPRAYSRLTLIVTDVRVQRVQEITEEDTLAEGVERQDPTAEDRDWCQALVESDPRGVKPVWIAPGTRRGFGPRPDQPQWGPNPQFAYRLTWDSLNAKRGYGWDANPWVCALTFDVHQQNIDAMKEAA